MLRYTGISKVSADEYAETYPLPSVTPVLFAPQSAVMYWPLATAEAPFITLNFWKYAVVLLLLI